jgi:site-specific DNA-methyltransferase (adenine-specific)
MQKEKDLSLHSICSYFAMFPPKVPKDLIERFSNPGDLVLDTFSGRGTTVLESRINNRKAIGIDLNPLAFVLSKAKSVKTTKKKVYDELKNIEDKYKLLSLKDKNKISKTLDLDLH